MNGCSDTIKSRLAQWEHRTASTPNGQVGPNPTALRSRTPAGCTEAGAFSAASPAQQKAKAEAKRARVEAAAERAVVEQRTTVEQAPAEKAPAPAPAPAPAGEHEASKFEGRLEELERELSAARDETIEARRALQAEAAAAAAAVAERDACMERSALLLVRRLRSNRRSRGGRSAEL